MAPSSASSFFFSSRRRHTRFDCDWSSDVCSSDLPCQALCPRAGGPPAPVSAAGSLPGAACRSRGRRPSHWSGSRELAPRFLARGSRRRDPYRSEEHTSELQSQSNLVCRLLLEKKKK